MSIYQPSSGTMARIKRRVAPYQSRRNLSVKLDRPLVSFTFDDCPKSVMNNALKPLETEGWQATIYMAMGRCGITNHLGLHMNQADVKAVYESGHEIGDHTFSHLDGTAVSLEAFEADIEENQTHLSKLGLPPSKTFAYPYGQVTAALKQAMGQRFLGSRGITSQLHKSNIDLNQIGSNRLYAGRDVSKLIKQINNLKRNPGWLTIFTHDVRDTPSRFGCTPGQMKTVINAVKSVGADIMTVANAIEHMERSHA